MTTSAATSRAIIPRLFKVLVRLRVWGQSPIVNLDVGGGRYNLGTDFAAKHNVCNLVFDPYNRDEIHNNTVTEELLCRQADTATISNVLNVIREREERLELLRFAKRNVVGRGRIFVTVFAGTAAQRAEGPKLTRDGWQEFRLLATYMNEIASVLSDVKQYHNIIEGKA